jgi:RNA methyltransferase, TrmH family
MLSKAVLKYISSLQVKKYRNQHQTFLVEGAKSVLEVLQSDFEIEKLFVSPLFSEKHPETLQPGVSYEVVGEQDLAKAGHFDTNNAALALVRMRKLPPLQLQPGAFSIALDDVRDPGNLGTILRIADWYGITDVLCSPSTADFYNPKVISASMGSFCRVKAHYLDLPGFFASLPPSVPLYGASLQGENVHRLQLRPEGILVMGNEARGISPEVAEKLRFSLRIPSFGGAESLNVAIATAILLDNFYRAKSL